MNAALSPTKRRFVLDAETAAELMTVNPISIAAEMSVREATVVLTDKEISAVPVIDEAGRPLGVLTHTDIVRHERHKRLCMPKDVRARREAESTLPSGEHLPKGFEIELTDTTPVRDIMTPTIVAVPEDATAERVLSDFRTFKVHHLFVVDDAGVVVGVISTFDIMRKLSPWRAR